MNKPAFFISGILIVLTILLIIILSLGKLTSFSISSPQVSLENTNLHAWTKAICDENNFCQDYIIECNGLKPLKISPITGAAVQFDSTWQDPRNIKQRERLCD